jgi:hypothetical protein
MNKISWIEKIFVINLDRSVERLEKCKTQAEKYKFKFERFPAIDGSLLTKTQKKYVNPWCKNFLCTDGMMGCGLSHLFILKKIMDENISIALILEDDFIWRDDTIDKLYKIKDFEEGIVKLSCIGPFCKSGNLYPEKTELPLGNAAYLIRFHQAKELYDKIKNVVYHIDLQYAITAKLNDIPIYYYDCIDVEGMQDSTIGNSKSTLIKEILPFNGAIKWVLNEPFIAPFGLKINLFLIISLFLIFIGSLMIYISKNSQYYQTLQIMGFLFLILGSMDILYYITT